MFSNEGSEDIRNAKAVFDGSEEDLLWKLIITQDMVKKQLDRLRDKASGPDELVPRFVNGIR